MAKQRQARPCTAHRSSDGEPCDNYAMTGQAVCHSHGGRSQRAREAAKRRQDEDRARAIVGRLLVDSEASPVTDPYAELLRLAGVLRNAAEVAGERLNELDTIRNLDSKGSEQLRSEAVLWREITALSRQTLVDIARLDVEERHLALEAAKTAAIIGVLEHAMQAADLTPAQQWDLRQACRDGFASLEAGR